MGEWKNQGNWKFGVEFKWQDPDIELTAEEEHLIEPACQCLQLFFYRYAYNEKHLLGEVMLGCVLSVVKENKPELAKLYESGIELFEETMLFLFNQSMNKQELLADLPSYFAVNWERNYNQEESSKEVRTQTANKLLQCLLHSRTSGDSVLQPMIDSIVDFDLEENNEVICFSCRRSEYSEEIDLLRYEYDFIFKK